MPLKTMRTMLTQVTRLEVPIPRLKTLRCAAANPKNRRTTTGPDLRLRPTFRARQKRTPPPRRCNRWRWKYPRRQGSRRQGGCSHRPPSPAAPRLPRRVSRPASELAACRPPWPCNRPGDGGSSGTSGRPASPYQIRLPCRPCRRPRRPCHRLSCRLSALDSFLSDPY